MNSHKLLRSRIGRDEIRDKEFHQNLEIYGEKASTIVSWSPADGLKGLNLPWGLDGKLDSGDGNARDMDIGIRSNGLR